ncbi:MAG: acetate--CoA ligase family protein [Bacillota bacterium]
MTGFSLREWGVRFPRQGIAGSADEAVRIARSLGECPVALKVVSPDIIHKTDAGGVVLGLKDEGEIRRAFFRIMENVRSRAPEARVHGVLVQEMVPPGVEAIVGVTRDPDFGPVMMFGIGGVFTDLIRDVAFRVLPLTEADARDMVASLRFRQILESFRGGPRVDPGIVAELLLKASDAGCQIADRLGSVDLNPVLLWEDGYCVVDEKVLLEDEPRPLDVEAPDTSFLNSFFEARSVAVVGASPIPGKIGYFVMDSLARHEYRGRVYPVNPGRDEVLGLKAWPSVTAIPDQVDMVVVTTPLDVVPGLIEECAAKGCRNMVVISGGGKELGGDRVGLEERIRRLARDRSVRIVGCNCIGVFDGRTRLDTFFQTHERMVRPVAGRVSMATQSGTVGAVFLEEMQNIGVSRFVSFGNRIDVGEADLLAFFAEDPQTDVIAVYVEGFRSGLKFSRAARALMGRKPVVVYKAGRTPEAAAAAVSHTGFYGGSYEVAAGVFRQASVIAVDSMEELVAVSKVLATLPRARGNRVAMISNGAGATVQAVDLLPAYGLVLAGLSASTVAGLRGAYPSFYQVGSLVDVTGSATVREYALGIQALLEDPGVDIVMPWFVLQDTPLEGSIVEALVGVVRDSPKPVVCAAAGGPYTRMVRSELESRGVPLLGSVREWVAAAAGLYQWGRSW